VCGMGLCQGLTSCRVYTAEGRSEEVLGVGRIRAGVSSTRLKLGLSEQLERNGRTGKRAEGVDTGKRVQLHTRQERRLAAPFFRPVSTTEQQQRVANEIRWLAFKKNGRHDARASETAEAKVVVMVDGDAAGSGEEKGKAARCERARARQRRSG